MIKYRYLLTLLALSAGFVSAQNEEPDSHVEKQVLKFSSSSSSRSTGPMGMMENMNVEVPFLGVKSAALTEEEATELGLKKQVGYHIKEVSPETPAAALGLTEGDIVTELDGRPVKNVQGNLDMHVAGYFLPGDSVPMKWSRDGEVQSGTAVLDQTRKMSELIQEELSATIGNLDDMITGVTRGNVTIDLGEMLKGLGGVSGITSSSNGVTVQTMMVFPLPDGSKAKIQNGNLAITDSNGQEVYTKENFTRDDLDEVPETYRDPLENVLKRVNLGGTAPKNKESIPELLEKLEDE